MKFYKQKKKQQATTKFREIKMYGTIFNYTGFGLQALIGKTPVYLNICLKRTTTQKKLTQESG